MSTHKYLDNTGLASVWAKIKALIPTKTSDLTNDSGFITTDEDTTYTISMANDTITLAGSDGSTSSIILPNGNNLSYGLTDGTLPLAGVAVVGSAELEE